jgi:hypothetical protein
MFMKILSVETYKGLRSSACLTDGVVTAAVAFLLVHKNKLFLCLY